MLRYKLRYHARRFMLLLGDVGAYNKTALPCRLLSTAGCDGSTSQKHSPHNVLHAKKFPDKVSADAPTLRDFIIKSQTNTSDDRTPEQINAEYIPYIDQSALDGNDKKVYFDVRGCQMNVNDAEIAWAVLKQCGYQRTEIMNEADIALVVTCAIRDSAERKVWNKITELRSLKLKRSKEQKNFKIGILGCMAERLKSKILEREDCVDVIAGPDAYKNLPLLLASSHDSGQTAVNVMLSFDETYADVLPVRLNEDSISAFVSIMRGCDNMCSYCIVPFTRGRERSRPISSILDEVRKLSDQGVKEVTLLGQNVNSYRDTSSSSFNATVADGLSKGFRTVYKAKSGGLTFVDLLDHVSRVDPEMRIRFTSPHPKDFPDPVLELIRERRNICNHIHLPAQSGCSEVLSRMRRGYSREAYLDLVDNIRQIIPDVNLSSDFITGFCGESDESHELTLDLLNIVKYNYIFVFPYSMRQKTHAYHKYSDDVPTDTKKRRMNEVSASFREIATKLNTALINTHQCVLIEKPSRRTDGHWQGRCDGGVRVVLPETEQIKVKPGDYVTVKITQATSQSLRGIPLCATTLSDYNMTLPHAECHTRRDPLCL